MYETVEMTMTFRLRFARQLIRERVSKIAQGQARQHENDRWNSRTGSRRKIQTKFQNLPFPTKFRNEFESDIKQKQEQKIQALTLYILTKLYFSFQSRGKQYFLDTLAAYLSIHLWSNFSSPKYAFSFFASHRNSSFQSNTIRCYFRIIVRTSKSLHS